MNARLTRWAGTTSLLALAFSPLAITATPATAQTLPSQAPKNVIVMIGDGMGYNAVDLYSAYTKNKTYRQVSGTPGALATETGVASQGFESWPLQTSMSTYSLTTVGSQDGYNSKAAWDTVNWVKNKPTDSAAAGTALSTGVKTRNGILCFDGDGNKLENLTQRADALGKATGVVTTVPYSHATPAAYASHNLNRNDLAGVAHEYITEDYLDVVMGAGHPFYDDSHKSVDTGSFNYVNSADWTNLTAGRTGFTFIEKKDDFSAIANGTNVPSRLFGVAQVGSTLQQGRAGTSTTPYDVPLNDVPDLATMSTAALNVLQKNDVAGKGFFTMIEGGAIDWAGHANQTARSIEETDDFVKAVDATVAWVEKNSSWDDTMVIVTADHETGYLTGAKTSGTTWDTINAAGVKTVPSVAWLSGDHTNQLVPLYAKGKGVEALSARTTKSDLVRGKYLDNTDVANFLLNDLWKPRDLITTGVEAAGVHATVNKAITIPVRVDYANATGSVSTKIGTHTITAALASGRAKLVLPAGTLPVGRHQLTINYSGSDTHAAGSAKVTVTVSKIASSTSVKVLKKVRKGSTATFVVSVRASGAAPTGKVTVTIGSHSVRAMVNSHGIAKVAFRNFKTTGKVTAKVSYAGNSLVSASKAKAVVRVIR